MEKGFRNLIIISKEKQKWKTKKWKTKNKKTNKKTNKKRRGDILLPMSKTLEDNVAKFKTAYENRDKNDIKAFAKKVVHDVGSATAPIYLRSIAPEVPEQVHFNVVDGKFEAVMYELNAKDDFTNGQLERSIIHGKFHLEADGLDCDIENINEKDWKEIEDTACESAAFFISKNLNIEERPAYHDYLIKNLPYIKSYKEGFENCNSISDFGQIFAEMRFGDNKNANWESFLDIIQNGEKFSIPDYAKNYLNYMTENKDLIVGRILKWRSVRQNEREWITKDLIIDILNTSITKFQLNVDFSNEFNEVLIFKDALLISMDEYGVIGI